MVTFTSVSDALRIAAISLAVCLCVCLGVAAHAQEDDKPPEPRPTDLPSLPDVLKEGTLELKARLYLPDGKGEPRFVPDMRLGEWLDVRAQAKRTEEADLPTYRFDQLTVAAKLVGGADVAEITAHAKITLSENASPVTAINLRMQSCQLSQPIAFEGSGNSRWQVSRTDPGYTWWLQAEPNSSHTATLVGQSVVTPEGDRQTLQLSLPAAPVTIEALLAADHQDVRVRGQGGELLSSEATAEGKKVVVRCLGGDVSLSWRSGKDSKPVAGAAEATSKTRWRIDDPRESWEAETSISLRSYGETIVDELTVDLPEGAQWLATPLSTADQFTITAEDSQSSDTPQSSDTSQNAASQNADALAAEAETSEDVAPATADPASPDSATADSATAESATAESATPEAVSAVDSLAAASTPAVQATDGSPTVDRAASPRAPVRLHIRALSRTGLSALDSIPIRWRWVPPKSDGDEALMSVAVPSIHVHGVDRHEVTTTLVIPVAYGLEWKSQQGTEFIQQTRVGDIPEQLQYVFRFARQPQGLIVSFRREVSLAEVRPTYLAEVDRGKVKLTGWLQCAFDRSQRPELALEMGDWELDSAQAIGDMSSPYAEGELLSQQTLPGGLVKLSNDLGADPSGAGRRQQQLWRIVAYRSLNEGSIEHLKLTVPSIMVLAADNKHVPIDHATGVLLMAASENVLISWDERSSQSLLADAVSSEWTALLQQLADRATAYRFQAGAKRSPVWSGRVEVLPRRIAVEQVAEVNIGTETARLTQTFTLQIANEALQRLQLLPRGAQVVSVLVDNVPCVLETATAAEEPAATAPESDTGGTEPTGSDDARTAASVTAASASAASEPDSQATADQTRLIVSGVPKLFGKVVVEIRSQLPLPSSVDDADEVIFALPLVKLDLPEAPPSNRVQVSIATDRRISASVVDARAAAAASTNAVTPALSTPAIASPAVSSPAGSNTGNSSTRSAASAWPSLPTTLIDISSDDPSLQLRIRRMDEVDALPVRVTGAWMQTAVSGSTRLDRFCARFVTQQEMLVVTIPSHDPLGSRVTVDGEVLNPWGDTSQGRLQLNLQDVALDGKEHTLEVWTWSANTLGWTNAIDVIPVQIDGCPRFEHFYWQLVTPPSQHLLFVPESVTAEWRWVWDRFWWHRYSPQDQAYFEQWLDASAVPPMAESANRYVVSTYGPVEPFRCWTASRLVLWLPIGLAAIGCALAVSIWRVLRHPVSIVLLATLIAAFAVTWPDLAILIGQTSLLALAIVMLYVLTQAAVESRVRRRSIFTTRPTSAMLETSDQHTLARVGSHVSSEVVATTRTQSPIIADSGGH